MNDKGHFYISLFKSLIRIIGCVAYICTGMVSVFASSFITAELLGIAEEIVDKRN